MKLSTLIFLCLTSFFICDGVRISIDETFIDAILKNFSPEIQKIADGISLKDDGKLDRLFFKIPNFNLNRVNLGFTNTGLLNLQINGLNPELSGRVTVKIIFKIRQSFTITLKNFYFNGNLRVGSKMKNGILVPDIIFDSEPKLNFTIKLSLGSGIIKKALAWLLSGIANLIKKFVMPAVLKLSNNFLDSVISKLPTDIDIPINGLNYKLDVHLSESGINLRNKFLEINSKARLYYPNVPSTKTKYFPEVYFPYITKMGSQLQIYISEYSISCAIYTLLASNNQEIKSTIKASKLTKIISGDKYGNELYLFFIGNNDVSLQITNEFLNINLPGIFILRTLDNKDILKLDIKLNLKVKISIQNGAKVTGVINDLTFIIKTITLNQLSIDLTKITEGLMDIKQVIITLLNEFIEKKLNFNFPTVMGIKFTQLSLEHKDHYLQINYNLIRN